MATKPTGGALETVIRKPVQYLMRARPSLVRLPSNQPIDHIQQQPGTFRVSVLSRLMQCIRRSWTYLLSRPRRRTGKPLIQLKNRSAIRIARAEAKDLLRLLHQSNVPSDAISRVAPALTRCFAQSEMMSTKIVALLLSIGAAVQYFPDKYCRVIFTSRCHAFYRHWTSLEYFVPCHRLYKPHSADQN